MACIVEARFVGEFSPTRMPHLVEKDFASWEEALPDVELAALHLARELEYRHVDGWQTIAVRCSTFPDLVYQFLALDGGIHTPEVFGSKDKRKESLTLPLDVIVGGMGFEPSCVAFVKWVQERRNMPLAVMWHTCPYGEDMASMVRFMVRQRDIPHSWTSGLFPPKTVPQNVQEFLDALERYISSRESPSEKEATVVRSKGMVIYDAALRDHWSAYANRLRVEISPIDFERIFYTEIIFPYSAFFC